MINDNLYFHLRILKKSLQLDFKLLAELNKENEKSLIELQKWAEKFPIKN